MFSRHLFGTAAGVAARVLALAAALALPGVATAQDSVPAEPVPGCSSWVTARVVALDQAWSWNRYGAAQPHGQMYALRHDVVPAGHLGSGCYSGQLQPGQVQLRDDKRPRPLVLRVNEGQCLRLEFTNLLHPNPLPSRLDNQPRTRAASMHIVGLQLVNTIRDDGSNAGGNGPLGDGIVDPGQSITYEYFAEREGTYVIQSMGAPVSGEGDSGTISTGLFGAVNVEPRGSEWYRSQVTKAQLDLTRADGGFGYPVINYNKTYTLTEDCLRAGKPVLKMLDGGGEIAHSDLTAIISGANGGNFGRGYLASTGTYPNRREPFREFTIIFHDEIGAVQAFPEFYSNQEDYPANGKLQYTLHSVRDAFAINYGTGGIGAEILANRLGTGPVHECVECLYEEFFLSAWAVGDPAMVVDFPANHPCTPDDLRHRRPCTPATGPKATMAFYPDDPSNVYHSYLGDHVKFRNLHAGSDDHHVFHLHAHQWMRTPRDPDSVYIDSQAIGQGTGFTYEIAYEGSGNRNKTVGDSIFHCHLYPHFAQGMWSMWRVHDVLEVGTEMNDDGRPAAGSRALPDGEILAGTPIPAIVPLPNQPMAPLPAGVWIAGGQVQTEDPAVLMARYQSGQDRANPGYPFYIPGVSGHRPPHPPLDTLDDGGLPRHVVTGNGTADEAHDRLDFHKHILTMPARQLNENGEPLEQLAMAFHANPAGYATPLPTGGGAASPFLVNGLPPAPGAPYADPCPPGSNDRTYKAANIQLDVVFNKAGWHFPQQRIITLLDDVLPTLNNQRPPEPLFFRAQEDECIEFQHTNLVPEEYEVDDFQVRTPTDILGQHIHLVKFDVTSSDGGGNGFNYEDGTFSPEEVQTRVDAIRLTNGCPPGLVGDGTNGYTYFECPEARPHPIFGSGGDANCNGKPDYLGAQTTVQRWWADTVESSGDTLRTVFTHDHYGPSTHQQVGLYAGLVVERPGTTWRHNETGQLLGTRHDGGPTSWQAVIDDGTESFREFLLEYGDFQLAYEAGNGGAELCPDPVFGYADPDLAINPPGRQSHVPHYIFEKPRECPASGELPPCPEAISADDPGTVVVNYRNEPLALRVRDPNVSPNQQAPHAPGLAQPGDLAFAYETRTDRLDTDMNKFPGLKAGVPSAGPYPPLTGGLVQGDPFTPVLRAFEGDRVLVKVLVGAHEEEHNFTVHGLNWMAEPLAADSGWRNSQMMAISEFFDLELGHMPSHQVGKVVDYLYKPSAAAEWQWGGLWGLIRTYRGTTDPNSTTTGKATAGDALTSLGAPVQLPSDPLVYTAANPTGRVDDTVVADKYGTADPTRTTPYDTEGIPQNLPAEPDGTYTAGVSNTSAAATAGGTTTTKPIGCPAGAAKVSYDITAVAASEVLAEGTLLYNWRPTTVTQYLNAGDPPPPSSPSSNGPLHDPTAILFVYTTDLVYNQGTLRPALRPDAPVEPLILRANAGDCIEVTLRNDIPPSYADMDGWSGLPMYVEHFNANDIDPSLEVSLHPQLVFADVAQSDGSNVGLNPAQYNKQSVAPGQAVTYYWYAGRIDTSSGVFQSIPIEYGAVNLSSVDPVQHSNKGAVGALIIEPPNSTWLLADTVIYNFNQQRRTRAEATIFPQNGTPFREFVVVFQDDINLRYEDDEPVMSLAVNEDPTETGQKAFNYRTEPIWFRRGYKPESPPEQTRNFTDFDQVLTDAYVGGPPVTHTFTASAGEATRYRVVHPGGHTQSHAFTVHGHVWEFSPYTNGSQSLGANPLSEWVGARYGHGPSNHFDALLKHGAGGAFGVRGEYLYRDYVPWYFSNGMWGIFEVK